MKEFLVTSYFKVEAEDKQEAWNKIFRNLTFLENNCEINFIGQDSESLKRAALKLYK